jgi:hypothetical protein
MPAFTIGEQITSTLTHYEDGDTGDLEYRLVDLLTGDPAVYLDSVGEPVGEVDWSDAAIVQTTATGDGPPWVYLATRLSTVAGGSLPAGTYQAQWRLPAAGPWIDDDEIVLAITAASWTAPTIDDLAALMFARVTGEFGPLQTFTTTSRPTAEQAQVKIDMAMGLIAPQVGFTLDSRYHQAARAIVILQAALLTEPGYWPEDLKDYRSAQEEWRLERDAALKALLLAIAKDDRDGDGGGATVVNPYCGDMFALRDLSLSDGTVPDWEPWGVRVVS